jgi:DNA-directed RNA polymerase subunit L
MKIVYSEENETHFALEGFDLGLASAIVDKLLEDKSVSFASADYDHPTTGVPVIKIKGKDGKASLAKAVAALKKDVAEFAKELGKA